MSLTNMLELARGDYWRAVMYSKIKESLSKEDISGDGVEFGGSNGIIQKMLPQVSWETRDYPRYDIAKAASYERRWDVILCDQVLEHTYEPWEAIRLIGKYTKKMAIITVPFLIRVHSSPHDFWRMTPTTLGFLAKPHFRTVQVDSWGNAKVNYWHAFYNRTSKLMAAVSAKEMEEELKHNDGNEPFVIWAILKK